MTTCLFTNYYEEKSPTRRAELDLCLETNLLLFDRIYILSDNVLEKPEWLLPASNIVWYPRTERPTYQQMLQVIRSQAHDVSIIANTDILFTARTLSTIRLCQRSDEAWCLTRWELQGSHAMRVWNVDYSQDAWSFHGPLRDELFANNAGDYYFGVPGCDNKFAHELNAAGYALCNPSLDVQTFHIHATGLRTATNTAKHRVVLPYMYVKPTKLGEAPQYTEILTLSARCAAIRRRK